MTPVADEMSRRLREHRTVADLIEWRRGLRVGDRVEVRGVADGRDDRSLGVFLVERLTRTGRYHVGPGWVFRPDGTQMGSKGPGRAYISPPPPGVEAWDARGRRLSLPAGARGTVRDALLVVQGARGPGVGGAGRARLLLEALSLGCPEKAPAEAAEAPAPATSTSPAAVSGSPAAGLPGPIEGVVRHAVMCRVEHPRMPPLGGHARRTVELYLIREDQQAGAPRVLLDLTDREWEALGGEAAMKSMLTRTPFEWVLRRAMP